MCENIPALCNMTTKDIDSVSFLPSKEAPDGECSLLTVNDVGLGRPILREKDLFAEGGVKIKEKKPISNPHI